jgi:hypothetical protein
MLVNSYKEFALEQKISVKKEVIYEFLLAPVDFGSTLIASVIDYVFNKHNLLTISEIDYTPNLLLPASFSFLECKGSLFYGQFIENFPNIYIFSSDYFKG